MKTRRKCKAGFTLLEIMTVVLLIGILLSIAVPAFNNARSKSRASAVMADLRQIDTAKQQYIFDLGLAPGSAVGDATALVPSYLNQWPSGPVASGIYAANAVGTNPTFMAHDQDWYLQHCTGSTADASCPL